METAPTKKRKTCLVVDLLGGTPNSPSINSEKTRQVNFIACHFWTRNNFCLIVHDRINHLFLRISFEKEPVSAACEIEKYNIIKINKKVVHVYFLHFGACLNSTVFKSK